MATTTLVETGTRPAPGTPGAGSVGRVDTNAAASWLAAGTRLLVTAGDLRGGRACFDLAYRLAETTGDAGAMAEAALGLGGLWVHEHRTLAAAGMLQARLERALERVGPRSALGVRLRARLAGEADYRRGEHTAVLAAVAETRAAADPLARAEALSMAHHCALGPGHGGLRRELADELIQQSSLTGRRSDLLMGLLWHTVDLFLDGDRHAERRFGELRDLLARDDHLAVGYVAAAIEVMLAIRAGRLTEAETLARACAERGHAAGDADADGWHGAQLIAIRWYQGRLAELLPMLHDLVRSSTLSAVDNAHLAGLAVAAATAGDRCTAAAALARVRGRDFADLPRSSSWLVTMHGVVQAAHLLGDAAVCARAYELLEPYADLPLVGSLAVTCFGSAQHTLGLAAQTTGQLDRAVAHFGRAVDANLMLGHWPAVRMSRLCHAQALRLRDRPGDAAIAARELAVAEEEAARVGIAAPSPASGAPASDGATATCCRDGRSWRVELGGRRLLVGHSVGMLHLAVLLANPNVEIPAVELVSGAAALTGPESLPVRSAQPVLDRTAIQQYRQRLSQLRDEIDELESGAEPERAARARAEQDWLVKEMTAGVGLGGRARGFTDDAERARLAAGRAIRRAIARIHELDPAVGDHLSDRVHTGMRCCYFPTVSRQDAA